MQRERAERLSLLVALEVRRVIRLLDGRQRMLVKIWSRHRAREPMLDTLFTRWNTLNFSDLALIETEAHAPLERFYEVVDDLRHYAAYTADMPATLGEQLEEGLEQLVEHGEIALAALGYTLDEEE